MGKAKNYYEAILQEDLREQLRYIIEALHALRDVPNILAKIQADQEEMRQWRSIMDPAVRDISRLVNEHELRISRLEAN